MPKRRGPLLVYLFVLTLSLGALSACATKERSTHTSQTATPDAPAAYDVTLIKDGTPQAVIVVKAGLRWDQVTADNPLAQDIRINPQIAAQELQYWLEKASGVKLPIVTDTKAPQDKMLILAGESALTQKYGLDCRTLPPEGIRITTFSQGLALLGDLSPAEQRGGYYCNRQHGDFPDPAPKKGDMLDRSISHAVFIFLEKFAGFRFIHGADRDKPEEVAFGTVIPKITSLTVPAGTDYKDAPSYQLRLGVMSVNKSESDQLQWKRCLKTGGTIDLQANHTHTSWHAEYGKSHPEIFAVDKKGKPYYQNKKLKYGFRSALQYAHPKVLELELEHIEYFDKHFKLHNGFRWYATPWRLTPTPCDGKWYDYSESAKPWSKPDGDFYETQSDLYWQYIAKLAAIAKKRWPQRMVVGSAYNRRAMPPSDKVKLPDNVGSQMALCRSSAMTTQKVYRDWATATIEKWYTLLGKDRTRFATWDYLCWPHGFFMAPTIHPHSQQAFLQEHHHRMAGQFVNPGGRNRINHVMVVIWPKLLWNKDLDVDAAIRDYCHTFFGPAGPHVAAANLLAAQRFENTPWATTLGYSAVPPDDYLTKIYPPEVVAQLKDHFKKAYAALTKQDDPIYKKRLDYVYKITGDSYWNIDGWEAFFRTSDLYHQTQKQTVIPVGAAPTKAYPLYLGTHIVEAVPTRDYETTFSLARSGAHLNITLTACTPKTELDQRRSDNITLLFYNVPAAKTFKDRVDEHENMGREETAALKQNAFPVVVELNGKTNIKGLSGTTTGSDQKKVITLSLPLKTLGLQPDKGYKVRFNGQRIITYKAFKKDKRGRKTKNRVEKILSLVLKKGLPWQGLDIKKRAVLLDLPS